MYPLCVKKVCRYFLPSIKRAVSVFHYIWNTSVIFHVFFKFLKKIEDFFVSYSLYNMNNNDREVDKISVQQHFADMIDSYQNLIFSICCKMTGDYFAAEDLTQETFLSAYRHMDSFSGENEKAWLCRIASNKCIDYLKSAGKRQLPAGEETFETKADTSPSPEEQILDREIRATLLKRCRELKPPYDRIATLYFYEEKNAKEIAAEQQKNLKTVQTQIYRARAMLRKLYEKERIAYE